MLLTSLFQRPRFYVHYQYISILLRKVLYIHIHMTNLAAWHNPGHPICSRALENLFQYLGSPLAQKESMDLPNPDVSDIAGEGI
jgi:hypothetical protein